MPKQLNFCPACGGRLAMGFPNGFADEPAQPICQACGAIFWQNSKPCAGVLVVNEGKLLLVRRAFEPFAGYWDVPGGFLAAGEHPEAGAIRELREETGLDVRLTGLVGIFMDTYGATSDATLNIFYLGEIAGGLAVAGSDATALGWFSPGDVPDDVAFECNRQAIQAWKNTL